MTSSSSAAATVPEDLFSKNTVGNKTHEVGAYQGSDDDVELDEYHGHLRTQQKDEGFTKIDAREMKRMGKKQELRVGQTRLLSH